MAFVIIVEGDEATRWDLRGIACDVLRNSVLFMASVNEKKMNRSTDKRLYLRVSAIALNEHGVRVSYYRGSAKVSINAYELGLGCACTKAVQ